MNSKTLLFALIFALGLVFASRLSAQTPTVNFPAASPACTLKQRVGLTDIDVVYSRPGVKDRIIFGGIVPYGQVWRTGANEATTFVTSSDITVGGTNVPAGSYTIFTVPNANKWSLVISKKTGEWGTDYPGPGEDLARIDMKVSKLPSPMENFTISYEKSGNGCTMNLDWENTRASVDLKAK